MPIIYVFRKAGKCEHWYCDGLVKKQKLLFVKLWMKILSCDALCGNVECMKSVPLCCLFYIYI